MNDVIGTAGLVCVVVGTALYSLPAAIILVGVLLVGLGFLLEFVKRKPPE